MSRLSKLNLKINTLKRTIKHNVLNTPLLASMGELLNIVPKERATLKKILANDSTTIAVRRALINYMKFEKKVVDIIVKAIIEKALPTESKAS